MVHRLSSSRLATSARPLRALHLILQYSADVSRHCIRASSAASLPVATRRVDLYPFEQTVASGASEADIIEKIDIGGISLIRAGAKNFNDVVIVPSKAEYGMLLDIINKKGAETDLAERKVFAEHAFGVSSHYDTAIHEWFAK